MKLTLLLLVSVAIVGCKGPGETPDFSPLRRSLQGHSVVYGDLTGDTIIDLLVGAPGARPDKDAAPRGALLIYRGLGDGTFEKKPTSIWGNNDKARFATRIVPLGDINGQGRDDFAITAPRDEGQTVMSGTVSIFYGEDPGNPVTLTGERAGDLFGQDVASGDLNGDGKLDLIISSLWSSDAAFKAGKVYVWFGGEDLAGDADVVIASDQINHAFGTALATIDLNGDNRDDLVVAGHGEYVKVFFGADTFAPNFAAPDVKIIAYPSTFDPTGKRHLASAFGATLANVGDMTGDGIDDLVIANPKRSDFETYDQKGAIYLYRGAATLPADLYSDAVDALAVPYLVATVLGHRLLDRFGFSITKVGDVDERGTPDILVGAPWANTRSPVAGGVYLLHGEDIATYGTAVNAAKAYGGMTPGGSFGLAVGWNSSTRTLAAGAPDSSEYDGSVYQLDIDSGEHVGGGGDGHEHNH